MAQKVRRGGVQMGGAVTSGRGGKRAIKAAGSGPVDSESDPQRGEFKKMVSPSSRRRAVKHIIGEGLGSAAQACRAIGLARSSLYRASQASEERREMQTQIIDLSQQHPRYGYRRGGGLRLRGGGGGCGEGGGE